MLDIFGKVWAWLNGKKSVLSAIAVALVVLGEQLGILLPLLGVEGIFVAKVASVIGLVVGLIHKVIKALG